MQRAPAVSRAGAASPHQQQDWQGLVPAPRGEHLYTKVGARSQMRSGNQSLLGGVGCRAGFLENKVEEQLRTSESTTQARVGSRSFAVPGIRPPYRTSGLRTGPGLDPHMLLFSWKMEPHNCPPLDTLSLLENTVCELAASILGMPPLGS